MKKIVITSPYHVEIQDAPIPAIKNNDVLIRVISGGICGSDIGIYRGTNALATYPRLIGHEYGGTVVRAGKSVDSLSEGDVVAVDPVRSCGNCYACRTGRHNVCSKLEVTGVHRDGGFAEYASVPASACYKLNTNKTDPIYAAMCEPYSIGMQINFRADVHVGDKVLVMGSGPIGLTAMQCAKARGASVMNTDLYDAKLDRALRMGADAAVNVKREDFSHAVMKWSPEGANVIVNTVCTPESFGQAVNLASPAGRIVILGLGKEPSQISQVDITKKELSILGSRLNNHRFHDVIQGFESGILTPQKLCTHTFRFTDFTKALELIHSHPESVCKVILTF